MCAPARGRRRGAYPRRRTSAVARLVVRRCHGHGSLSARSAPRAEPLRSRRACRCVVEPVRAAGRERRAGKTSRCSGGGVHTACHSRAALLLWSRGRYGAQHRSACARGQTMPVFVRVVLCAAFSAPLCAAAAPDLRTFTLAPLARLPGAAQRAARTLCTVVCGCVVPACVCGAHRAAFSAPAAAQPTARNVPRKPALTVRSWCVITCHAPSSMSACACYPRLRSCSAPSSAVLCPAGQLGFPPTLLQAASARHLRGQRHPG